VAKRLELRPKERTLWISFVCEIGWAIFALLSAMLANSIALWANAFRVNIEALLCFLALYGTVCLLKQKGHHYRFEYGLGKIEHVFSLFGGLVAFTSFLFIGWQSIERFRFPQPTEGAGLGIVVLALASSYNIWFYFRFRQHARSDHSPILHTQCAIYRNATIGSLTTMVAVLIPSLFPYILPLHYLDPLGAVILSFF
jgi:cation diffusion facilitator family transporter